MNKKQYQAQPGSIHLVVIIVLVAALIGSLGFVFYQNYMQPKTSDNNAVVNNETDNAATTVADTVDDATTTDVAAVMNDDGYLVFNDWNVKFELPTDYSVDSIVTSEKTTEGAIEYYDISTARVAALGDDCAKLFRLIRSEESFGSSIGAPTLAGQVEGYYYGFSSPQVACSDNSKDIQSEDSSMLQTMLMTVEKK